MNKENAYKEMEQIRQERASKFAEIFDPIPIGFEAFKHRTTFDGKSEVFFPEDVVIIYTQLYPQFGLFEMDEVINVNEEMFQVVYKNQKENIIKLVHLPRIEDDPNQQNSKGTK